MIQLIFIMPSSQVSAELFDVTKQTCCYLPSSLYTSIHCLFAFGAGIWNCTRENELIQISLKKHSLYNLNWSCFEHRVACATKPCRVVLQLLWLCKIIEKSVMGESFFFLSYETWSSTPFSIHTGIKNRESSRESRLAVDCQLSFER